MNYTLVITIASASYDIVGPDPDNSWKTLPSLLPNSTYLTPYHLGTISNNGLQATLQLSATSPGAQLGGWDITSATGTPADNRYRVSAIVTGSTAPTAANFTDADILTATATKCSATQFCFATADANGASIDLGGKREMYLTVTTGALNTDPITHFPTLGSVTPKLIIDAQAP